MSRQFDVSNPKHVKLARRLSRSAQQEADAVLFDVMSRTAGRTWIHTVLLRAHTGASSFSTNALQMAFIEGERNVGILLIDDIMRVCPDYYVEMMREANARSSRTTDYPDESADDDAGDSDDASRPNDAAPGED